MYQRGFVVRAFLSTALVPIATAAVSLAFGGGCSGSSAGNDATPGCTSCGTPSTGGSSGGAVPTGSDDAGESPASNGSSSGSGSSSGANGSSGGALLDDAGSTTPASGSSPRADAGSDGDDAGNGNANANADANAGGGSGAWDLTGWQLQLPIGTTDNPQLVDNPNGFSDIYFSIPSDGSLTFMDPPTGVTTSGSLHPRSELRELTSWAATGKNVETATVAVTKVPTNVTIGQIFQAPPAPSKPLLELQYQEGGQIAVLLETTNEGGNAGAPHPIQKVTAGAQFEYALSLSNNTIEVTINGTSYPFELPSSFQGESFYFKWGDYDQTATSGPISTVQGTVVKFYKHAVTHQ